MGGTGEADGGRTCIPVVGIEGGDMAVLAPDGPGVSGVAVGGLVGFSFFFRGTLEPSGGPPGVPGNGCFLGRPRPRCGVGPGVAPGVPGVPDAAGVPGALAAAAAAAAAALTALALLRGLDGVAVDVDGVPGNEVLAGIKGADVGVPIGPAPGSIGKPLGPNDGTPGGAPYCGIPPCSVPGIELYGDSIMKPLGPA